MTFTWVPKQIKLKAGFYNGCIKVLNLKERTSISRSLVRFSSFISDILAFMSESSLMGLK